MDRDELGAWLRLTLTPGVGNQTARDLLAAFGLPGDIFRQSVKTLMQVARPAQVAALSSEPASAKTQLDLTWNWLHGKTGGDDQRPARRVVTLGDAWYPTALLDIDDPPLVLYYLGSRTIESDPGPGQPPMPPAAVQILQRAFGRGIAIVGSRNPTPQGAANARQFARTLAQAGLTVVSGLALGIDGAAHEGALEGVGVDPERLATIAVVGTGLDRVYPRRHLDLARRIANHGLMVSEYPIGTLPLAANFPRRNRLIAGLSQGTLVVEAALKSGSLITARLAAEQGKEVLAIPGSIHSTQSRGCHVLIKQGAKLVESAQDVLEEMNWGGSTGVSAAASQTANGALSHGSQSGVDEALLEALGYDPVSLDALQARTGIDTAHLQAQLMALELNGQVARLPGGLFQRIVTA